MSHTFHQYREGVEALPGCRLLKRLGEGGFGEVWKASRSGNVYCALKIINLTEGEQGFSEFESLRFVKNLRNPHLMPIHGFWLKDKDGNVLEDGLLDRADAPHDQLANFERTATLRTAACLEPAELLIEMGLGDKSLNDRLKECKEQSLEGVPLDELLKHMRGAAEGIDFLNHQSPPIVHGDIKPANLLLVGGAAVVCDFGLARAIEGLRKTRQNPFMSMAYAAPETIDTRQGDRRAKGVRSDQYSLAITYCELRTGELPLGDVKSPYDVMVAHTKGRLDLSRLPKPEQLVIKRATKLAPESRWDSSLQMVEKLYDAREALKTRTSKRLSFLRNSTKRTKLVAGVDTEPEPETQPILDHWDKYPRPDAEAPARGVRTVLFTATLLLASLGIVGWKWRPEIVAWLGAGFPGGSSVSEPPSTDPDITLPVLDGTPLETLIALQRFAEAMRALDSPAAETLTSAERQQVKERVRQGWIDLAQAHVRRRLYMQSIEDCDQILRHFPDDSEARLILVRAALRLGDRASRTRAREELSRLQQTSSLDGRLQPLFRALSLLHGGIEGQADLLASLPLLVDVLSAPKSPTNDPWTLDESEFNQLAELTPLVARRALNEIRTQPLGPETVDRALMVVEQLGRLPPDKLEGLSVGLRLLEAEARIGKQDWPAARRALQTIADDRSAEAQCWQIIVELHDQADSKLWPPLLEVAKTSLPELALLRRLAVCAALRDLARADALYLDPAVELLRSVELTSDFEPLLAELLAKRVERFVARAAPPSDADYKAALQDCEQFQKCEPFDEFVSARDLAQSCAVECLLNLNQSLSQSQKLPAKSATNDRYLFFVRALAASKTAANWPAVVELLAAALAPSDTAAAFDTDYRRRQAQSLLVAATWQAAPKDVAKLLTKPDGKLLSAEQAEPLYRLLETARGWSDRPSLPVKAALLIAGQSYPSADAALLASYAAEVVQAPDLSAVVPDALPLLWVLVQGQPTGDAPTRIAAGMQLLNQIELKARLRDADAVAFYRQSLQPLVELARREFDQMRRTPELARFCGAAGEFVADHRFAKAWQSSNGLAIETPSLREDLFQRALQIDSQPWRFIAGRGEALLDKAEGLPASPARERLLERALSDAESAIAITEGTARGRGLRGHCRLLVARGLPRAEQSSLFELAAADLDAAVQRLPRKDVRLPLYYYCSSLVHTEWANAISYGADRPLHHQLLQKSADAADQAVQHQLAQGLPYIEYYYRALGNALEDLAWQARIAPEVNYGRAAQAFRSAVDADREHKQAHRDLGRCYSKILDDPSFADDDDFRGLFEITRDNMLQDGVDHLRKAIAIDANLADAYRWLGALYVSAEKFDEADEAFDSAVQKAAGTANHGDYLWRQAKARLEHVKHLENEGVSNETLTAATAQVRELAVRLRQVAQIDGGLSSPAREAALLTAESYSAENDSARGYAELKELVIAPNASVANRTDADVLRLRIELRRKLTLVTQEIVTAAGEDIQLAERAGMAETDKAEAYYSAAVVGGKLSLAGSLATGSDAQKRLLTDALRNAAAAIRLDHENSVALRYNYNKFLNAKITIHRATPDRAEIEQALTFLDEILSNDPQQRLTKAEKDELTNDYKPWLEGLKRSLGSK